MTMAVRRAALLGFALAASSIAMAASAPPPVAHAGWPAREEPAIRAVVETFRQAVIARDGAAISDLMLDSRATFNMIGAQDAIDENRRFDRNYTGLGASGFSAFSRFLASSKGPVEERFRNLRVEQDGPLALVAFDYEFVADGKVENTGLEHWMLRKIDGRWKIFSVVWTERPLAETEPKP